MGIRVELVEDGPEEDKVVAVCGDAATSLVLLDGGVSAGLEEGVGALIEELIVELEAVGIIPSLLEVGRAGVDELLGLGCGWTGWSGGEGGPTTGTGSPIGTRVGAPLGATVTNTGTASVSVMVCSGNGMVRVIVTVLVIPCCRTTSSSLSRGRRANKYFW